MPDEPCPFRSAMDIFIAAAELSGSARESYLREACGQDADLRARVDGLLTADRAMGGFLDPVSSSRLAPGDRLGRYEVQEFIGRGSFGDVYRARQTSPVDRIVAIKVLTRADPESMTRFEYERQALALLEHEGIARLYDAGEDPSRRPYLVMEYVEGRPVTQWATEARLAIPARLELFLRACEAVQHAHQRGFIHRDLKPSNILVGGEVGKPVVKVIDFGIARIVETPGHRTPTLTEVGQLLGTREYMAPEQARGEGAPDTRRDVYSLGVVLYELICGEMPIVACDDILEWLRRLAEESPERPSVRLARRAARRGLEAPEVERPSGTRAAQFRELDWIVLRALEKNPEGRYQSVADLAADIRRFLRGEALQAGPPSAAYRLRKLARRHRVGMLAGAAVLVIAGAGTLATGMALARASLHASEASERHARLLATMAFSRELHGSIADAAQAGDSPALLSQLVDRCVRETDAEFVRDNAARPSILDSVGRTLQAAGRPNLAEPCLARAFAMRRTDLGENNPATWQSAHALAMLFDEQGELDRAAALAREAMEHQTRLLGAIHDDTLSTTLLYGLIQARQPGHASEGLALMEQTLDAARRAWGSESSRVAILESNIAGRYKSADRPDLALPLYEHALAVLRAILGEDDPETLSVGSNLAGLHSQTGDPARAREILLDIVPRCIAVLGETNPQTLRAMNNLGAASELVDRLDEAERWYRAALDAQRGIFDANHPDVITTMSNLGIVLFKRGTPESLSAARTLMSEARDLAFVRFGERNARTLQVLNNEAMVLDALGDPRAGEVFRKIVDVAAGVQGGAHVNTLIYMSNAAAWFEMHGDLEAAATLFERAAEVSARERGESDFASLWAAMDLAIFLRNRGEHGAALARLDRVVALAREAEVEAQYLGVFLTGQGKTLLAAGRAGEALSVLTEAEALLAAALGEESPQLASTRAALDAARAKLGERPTP